MKFTEKFKGFNSIGFSFYVSRSMEGLRMLELIKPERLDFYTEMRIDPKESQSDFSVITGLVQLIEAPSGTSLIFYT